MPQCERFEICFLDAEPGEDLCILHSQNPVKDKEKFDKALAAHTEEKGSNFQHFLFPEHAVYFKGARFADRAVFFFAKFAEGCDFSDATFFEGADFSRARFAESAKFVGVRFDKGVKFSGATFYEGTSVDFRFAKFADWAYFSNATFGVEKVENPANVRRINESLCTDAAIYAAEFDYALFHGEAYFDGAIFNEQAWFDGATFAKGADFSASMFSKKVVFSRARFLGRTLFAPRKGDRRTIQIFSERAVHFEDVDISPLDALVFRDADLQKCQFLGTDLRKAEFTNVKWPKIICKIWPEFIWMRWPQMVSRFGVYDEIEVEQKGQAEKRSHVEQLYRQLKQNHEDRRDYKRAGDFHYGEEEMRRKNTETPLGLRIFLTLYWLVSGYGERCLRPLICAAGIVVFSTFLYLFWGLQPKDGSSTLALTSLRDWSQAAHYSFQVMTLLRPDDLIPVGCAKAVMTFETLIGPILLGLFTWTLKQRLLR